MYSTLPKSLKMELAVAVKVNKDPEEVERRKKLCQDRTPMELGNIGSLSELPIPAPIQNLFTKSDAAEKPEKPKRIVKGHNKPVTKLIASSDGKTIYTGGSDGVITSWDSESGRCERVSGPGHGAQVSGLAVSGSSVLSIGFDDTLRSVDTASCSYSGSAVSLAAQPRAITSKGDVTYVVTMKSIVSLKQGAVVDEMNVEYEPSCCAFSPAHNHLVVGEAGGNTVRVYSTQAGQLDLVKELTLTGAAQDMNFSPDGKYLVTADSNRKVTLFNAGFYDKPNNKEWGFHTAKVRY